MEVGLHTQLKPGDLVNVRWQAEMAPLMEVAHNYSGAGGDRLPVIFRL